MGTKQIRVDDELVAELQRIQDEMKKKITGIDFSKPQASKIAASILRQQKEFVVKKNGKKTYDVSIANL